MASSPGRRPDVIGEFDTMRFVYRGPDYETPVLLRTEAGNLPLTADQVKGLQEAAATAYVELVKRGDA